MARYCSIEDVKDKLPKNIIPEGDNPTPNFFNPAGENLPSIDIDDFIKQASDFIDASLGTMYDIPLHKVNQGGDVDYPKPIRELCSIFAAERIIKRFLQGADRQSSEEQKAEQEFALQSIESIKDGSMRLAGHIPIRAHRFIRQTLLPSPQNPTQNTNRNNR